MDKELKAMLVDKVEFGFTVNKNTLVEGVITSDTQFSYTIRIVLENDMLDFFDYNNEGLFLEDVPTYKGRFEEHKHKIKADVKKWAIDKLFD